jgi:predicted enzyme related to lactoylglutathione lyase
MSNADVRGRFVWHELLTTDTAAAAAFYPRILPWRTQASNMPGYTIFMAGASQVAGFMELPAAADSAPAHWMMYVGTPNVDDTCAQAQSLGARLCKAPSDIPNVGRFAVLADPQGATFAVFTPGSGPPPSQPQFGGFSWHELATTDVASALRFYGALFGWTKGVSHDMGAMGIYQLVDHGGTSVGGMCNTQGPSTPPSWLSYVHVADSSRAVAAAKAAGGRLLHGPVEVPGGSWIALFLDPQGGAFAVHEMPKVTAVPSAQPAVASPAAVSAAPKKAAATPVKRPARKKNAPVVRKPAIRRKAVKKAVKKAARSKAKPARPPKKKARAGTRKVRPAARKKAPRRR